MCLHPHRLTCNLVKSLRNYKTNIRKNCLMPKPSHLQVYHGIWTLWCELIIDRHTKVDSGITYAHWDDVVPGFYDDCLFVTSPYLRHHWLSAVELFPGAVSIVTPNMVKSSTMTVTFLEPIITPPCYTELWVTCLMACLQHSDCSCFSGMMYNSHD